MDITHGKYLGVDYGDVRTGLAECEVSGLLAGPIGTIAEGGMRNTAVRVASLQSFMLTPCVGKIVPQPITAAL